MRWTPQSRRKQSQAIHKWSPWEKSTGPRTLQGKYRSSQNARKHHDEFDDIGMTREDIEALLPLLNQALEKDEL